MPYFFGLWLLFFSGIAAAQPQFQTIQIFSAQEARQAVVAHGAFFYAIDNASIGKYDANTGQPVASWQAPDTSHVQHLNSGFILNDTLFAAQSNYPDVPRTSSIEMWDANTLAYLGSRYFGQTDGAANWVLYHKGYWWVLFAHYTGKVAEPGRSSKDTRLDKFAANWQQVASYCFPAQLVNRFQPKSLSGGAFGPDGYLYATGHDEAEVYQLQIPDKGNEIQWLQTLPVECEGQGIAWQGNKLYTIKRNTKEVVISLFQP